MNAKPTMNAAPTFRPAPSDAGVAPRVAQFVIRPNRSLSRRGNQLFFLTLFCTSFIIAGAFTAMGMWVILPFAGFEMLCLGVALYCCAHRLSRRETVVVDGDEVRVSSGHEKPEQSCTFQRAWARVVLSPPDRHGASRRLWIRSHGRQVEIGSFLNDADKGALARALDRAIGDEQPAAR